MKTRKTRAIDNGVEDDDFAEQLAKQIGQAPESEIPKDVTATRRGWWIKVCVAQTHSVYIDFAIGPDSKHIISKRTWVHGSPTEFDLPEVNQYRQIYLYATGEYDKSKYFGVCYGEQVCCKHYDFDKDEDHDVINTDADEWKCTRRSKPILPEPHPRQRRKR